MGKILPDGLLEALGHTDDADCVTCKAVAQVEKTWVARALAAEEKLAQIARMTEQEIALRYIQRVRSMMPGPYAMKMLNEQEEELRKGNHD